MKRIIQILTYSLLLVHLNLNAQRAKDSYSSSSVLATGKWFRIAVTSDGIYKIDYAKLKQLGFEDPSYPRIYCNNFGQLSYNNDAPKPDDLKELSIFISGNDNILNEGDYLLFFGKGTGRWLYNYTTRNYEYLRHNYSDTAYYFITCGAAPGKRVATLPVPSQPASFYSSGSDALFIHEKEDVNLIKSGRDWFQEISGIDIDPGFSDILVSEMVKFRIRVAARASVPTLFRLNEGESLMKSIQVQPVNMFDYTGTYAQIADSSGYIQPESATPVFNIRFFNNGETGAHGWLDFAEFEARKSNSFNGQAVIFSDSRAVSPGGITEYTIRSSASDPIIWDITDAFDIKNVQYSRSGDNNVFKAPGDSLKTFVAFTPDNVSIPVFRQTEVVNQDLHSSDPSDMIIITHPLFREYAQKLADIHLENSGLVSQVVLSDQIYNEFSGGVPDICAIRNFIRMKYMNQKETAHPLKYILLFGDGSYQNKTLPPDNPNFVPTYQSQNSNIVVSSFTSDDFYGLLNYGEGEMEANGESTLMGTLNIGIGRLPVSDTVQAGIMISKIRRYLDPANMGDWKNVICLTADDEDGNIHMSDAEGLAAIIQDSVPSFNVDKIYLDAYRQITTVNGQSYPDVNRAINDRINSGCLIFNYTGHGNEAGLAHELVIKPEDINSWKNNGKLPLFITATCEFSRFDDIDINILTRVMTPRISGGEMVLLNSNGGGIALMSTTRVVYSAPNSYLNRNIFNYAFSRDESGNTLCFGDIIRTAKNKSGNGSNKWNFTLLGDPALKLAYPWHGNVLTDSINNVPVSENTDSLKALSMITIAGHIEDQNGQPMTSFNGVVSPIVFDKISKIKTLANDGGSVMEFGLRNNVIFSGKTMATDGRFRFTFIVPRDINYSFGNGKISYYANNSDEDMYGNFTKLIVGGFSNLMLKDTIGPDIKLFINDTLFRNGGITDSNPRLLAIIEDKGGINTTGSGIGHDLTGFLDNDPNRSFVLNNYFESDFDNYMKGKISYDLTGLTKGSHSITLKAWDNFNNSSEKTINFVVEADDKFILKNLINYPNPFFSETNISAEHNRPDNEFNVTINIFSLNGRILKIIKANVLSSGYNLPPVVWDGKDDSGNKVGRGIYPYTVIITTGSGETATASGRMIIL